MDRIAAFKTFIDQRPDDPFPVYSLAMEHKNLGEHDEAQVWFDRLRERFPDYVATYFHAGANLAALGRKRDAIECYRAGMSVAERAGDTKTRDEIAGALALAEDTQ